MLSPIPPYIAMNPAATITGNLFPLPQIPEKPMAISKAFSTLLQEAPAHAKAWMETAKALDEASALDKKTGELAYIAVLAATGNLSGIPWHVLSAKSHGASREEVLSAVLVGLPAIGAVVIGALPAALDAYDGDGH